VFSSATDSSAGVVSASSATERPSTLSLVAGPGAGPASVSVPSGLRRWVNLPPASGPSGARCFRCRRFGRGRFGRDSCGFRCRLVLYRDRRRFVLRRPEHRHERVLVDPAGIADGGQRKHRDQCQRPRRGRQRSCASSPSAALTPAGRPEAEGIIMRLAGKVPWRHGGSGFANPRLLRLHSFSDRRPVHPRGPGKALPGRDRSRLRARGPAARQAPVPAPCRLWLDRRRRRRGAPPGAPSFGSALGAGAGAGVGAGSGFGLGDDGLFSTIDSSSAISASVSSISAGNGSVTRIVSSRSGEVESSATGAADQFLDPAHILDRLRREIRPAARALGGVLPARHGPRRPASARLRAPPWADGRAARRRAVAGADLERLEPVEHVELGQRDAVHARGLDAGLPHQCGVEPAAAALAARGGAEFMAPLAQALAVSSSSSVGNGPSPTRVV
jgi:hypothetical protein